MRDKTALPWRACGRFEFHRTTDAGGNHVLVASHVGHSGYSYFTREGGGLVRVNGRAVTGPVHAARIVRGALLATAARFANLGDLRP